MSFLKNLVNKIDLGLQWLTNLRQIKSAWEDGDLIGSFSAVINLFTSQSQILRDVDSGISPEAQEIAHKTTVIVSGTSEKGIAYLNKRIEQSFALMNEMKTDILNTQLLIDQRFQVVIEQFKLSILLQQDMVRLLKMSDSEKLRIEYMREGIKFLKHAPTNERHYEDAIFYFEKALLQKPTDYFPHQCIGHIFLFSIKHFSAAKAESHFEKAAAYAVVEMDELKLLNNGLADTESTGHQVRNPQMDAASSYYHAALCCFLQKKFVLAKTYLTKALRLNEQFLDASLLLSKVHFALDEDKDAIALIEKAINKDNLFLLKLLADSLLRYEPLVLQLLERIRLESQKKALSQIAELELSMLPGSMAHRKLVSIKQELLNEDSLLGIEQANNLLLERLQWDFSKIHSPSEMIMLSHIFFRLIAIIELRVLQNNALKNVQNINALLGKYYYLLPFEVSPLTYPVNSAGLQQWKGQIRPRALNLSVREFVFQERAMYQSTSNLLAELN